MTSPIILWNVTLLLIGLLTGAGIGWLLCQLRVQSRVAALRIELAQFQEARLLETEKTQWLATASGQLQTTFEALASKSLQTNADEFLKRAGFCRHVCAQ